MEEKKKVHSILSSTAVKLSVYSSFLDFGLTISVFLLQRKILPIAMSSFLLNLFDDAIAYLTFAIIFLFLAAVILRLKEQVIVISPKSNYTEHKQTKKLVVSIPQKSLREESIKTGIIKINPTKNINEVQRVVTKNNQDFIKFNGIWYRVTKDKFDKVSRPDY